MVLDGVFLKNPSNLKFVIDSNRMYIRNLENFDATWLGYRYNYWIDISTDNGKAQY